MNIDSTFKSKTSVIGRMNTLLREPQVLEECAQATPAVVANLVYEIRRLAEATEDLVAVADIEELLDEGMIVGFRIVPYG